MTYAKTLQHLGCLKFTEDKSLIAVEHLLRRSSQVGPRKRIMLTWRLRKEQVCRRNYGALLRELIKEAKEIDRQIASDFAPVCDESDIEVTENGMKRTRMDHKRKCGGQQPCQEKLDRRGDSKTDRPGHNTSPWNTSTQSTDVHTVSVISQSRSKRKRNSACGFTIQNGAQ